MILYVNGDSHAAAAEAVCPHVFAEDDPDLFHLGRRPHPANLNVGWPTLLAKSLHSDLVCDAESASSNHRILRTTRDWIQRQANLDSALIIIQWSTWEREEWFIDDRYHQVNASGLDHVPTSARERYRSFISQVDWLQCTVQAHDLIWQLHQELQRLNISHVFFNGNSHFGMISDRRDWGTHYLAPYQTDHTYDAILRQQGFKTVNDQSWHFGADAHCFWAGFMLHYIKSNQLLV